jgi:hypothetical protein
MFHENNFLIETFKVVIREDRRPADEHERRFNAPQVDEVAVVISGDEFHQWDMVSQRRGDLLQRISETHRSCDGQQYPVIFPRAADGYHFNLRQVNQITGKTTSKKILEIDFYAYRLNVRDTEQNHILNCRQLFHKFIVNMYEKIESERLLYICLNQRKLRAEEHIHLRGAWQMTVTLKTSVP